MIITNISHLITGTIITDKGDIEIVERSIEYILRTDHLCTTYYGLYGDHFENTMRIFKGLIRREYKRQSQGNTIREIPMTSADL